MNLLVPDVPRPESPPISYAPPESQIKQWAQESPIERSFPPWRGEQSGCDVTGNAGRGRISNHHRAGSIGDNHPSLGVLRCILRMSRPGAEETDAGRKSEKVRRRENYVLTSSPIERRFIALRPPPPRSNRLGASITELRG
jgi:hypothetical protein